MARTFYAIKSFWGTSLRRFSTDVLERFSLSADTKSFLTEVGLPTKVSEYLGHALVVNFYFPNDQVTRKTYHGGEYCVIGDDSGNTFAISSHDNAVYAIDFNDTSPELPCFVNASIWQFLNCLQIFAASQQVASGETDQAKFVKEMVEKFSEVDPHCLDHPSNWWAMVIHQPY